MSIRRFVFPVLCAIAFGVSAPAFAQGVENAVPPVAATTGKFVFTFTVTVSSNRADEWRRRVRSDRQR
jgi:hypothetical protein